MGPKCKVLGFPMMKDMFFVPRARLGTYRPDGALYSGGLYGTTNVTALRT
jgi:hypothetical protein